MAMGSDIGIDLRRAAEAAHSRYALSMALEARQSALGARWGTAAIALLLLLLAGLSPLIPASDVTLHNVLHHMNFLPLMMAGMLFGWRGALLASVCAALVNVPLIVQHWVEFPMDAKDQVVELSIFSAAGLIAGYLSDRERAHRRNLEQTRQTLEHVYLELSDNVARMKKAERLSAAGQLAASLAHEIRNPLASISGAAGILTRGAAPPEYIADSLEIIQKESQRLNKLLTGFLNFAKPRSPRLQRADPNAILASVASLAAHTAEARQITLARTAAECPEVECDPEQLKQVLLNLVINAIEASPTGAEIRLRTRAEVKKILIEVEDSGNGIPEEIAVQVFDPFFTTKPKGTGLGLAVSSMIVAQHNGSLSFENMPQGGATFRLELPAGEEKAHGQ